MSAHGTEGSGEFYEFIAEYDHGLLRGTAMILAFRDRLRVTGVGERELAKPFTTKAAKVHEGNRRNQRIFVELCVLCGVKLLAGLKFRATWRAGGVPI
jgi:hypothetical protein